MQKLATQTSSEEASRLMNVQVTIDLVIQQLERLERVSGQVNREGARPRSEIGDQNHKDTETNLAALEVKLLALQGILQLEQQTAWTQECATRITSWYQERKGQHSQVILQAVYESLSACAGKFNPGVRTVVLTSTQLADFAGKLGQATEVFHEMQDEVKNDPDEYLRKGFVSGKECDIDYSLSEVRKDMRSSNSYQRNSSQERPKNDRTASVQSKVQTPEPTNLNPIPTDTKDTGLDPVNSYYQDAKLTPKYEKRGCFDFGDRTCCEII